MKGRVCSTSVWSPAYNSFLLNGGQLSPSRERRRASGDSGSAFFQYVIHAPFSSASLGEAGLLPCAKWRRAKCRLESTSLSLLLKREKLLLCGVEHRQLLWASQCGGNRTIYHHRHGDSSTQQFLVLPLL